MNNSKNNKSIVMFILVFISTMFFTRVGIMANFEAFSILTMIPVVMLMVFGLLVFLIVKNSSNKVQKNNPIDYSLNEERHCTSCHESIEINHEFCPYCGFKQTDYVVCDYCGHHNSKHDLLCTECNGLLK